MRLELDESSSLPLAEQIAAAVRHAVATGELAPGDRLPSGRDLAESSGVTLETVQRGYRLLAEDGVVVARVGRGTSVARDVDVRRLSLVADIDEVIRRSRRVGLSPDDVVTMIRDRWPAGGIRESTIDP